MQEWRRFLRWNRARNGQIRFRRADGFDVVGCVVKDYSVGGAQLLVPAGLDIPAEFQLSCDGLDQRDCLVKWQSDGRIGVAFIPQSSPGAQPSTQAA